MIITPAQIRAAAAERLREAFPGEPVYEDLTPQQPERPSSLVEVTGIQLEPLALGGKTVRLRYQVKITAFCQADEVRDPHLPEPDLWAMTVLGLFARGYVRAGDRALRVSACKADTALPDAAEILLTLELALSREEFDPTEERPLMEALALNTKTKEEHS